VEVLKQEHAAGSEYVEGNKLSKAVMEQLPEETTQARTALGGKGWLRNLIAAIEGIQQVQALGRDEPCYSLNEWVSHREETMSTSWPGATIAEAAAPSGAPATAWRQPVPAQRWRPQGGFMEPQAWDVGHEEPMSHSVALSPTPYLREKQNAAMFQSREKLGVGSKARLSEAVQAILSTHQEQGGSGWMPGSLLSKELMTLHSDLVTQAKAALRDKASGNKGWLKRLLESDPDVSQVSVEGVGEPCFSLSTVASTLPQLNGKIANSVGGEQAPPAGYCASLKAESASLDENLRMILIECAVEALGDVEYLEGNKLSNKMKECHAEAWQVAKKELGGLKGKGWMKKLVDTDPRLEQIDMGRGEPCYRLSSAATFAAGELVQDPAANAAGGLLPGLGDDRAPFSALGVTPRGSAALPGAAGQAEPRQSQKGLKLTPAEVLERLGQQDFDILCNFAVDCLMVHTDYPYLEGNKLSDKIRELDAELAAKAKSALGNKGWLKHILESEPRIQRVQVPGKDEPCWQLTGDMFV